MLQQHNPPIYRPPIRWLPLGKCNICHSRGGGFLIFLFFFYCLNKYSRALPPPPAHHSSARPMIASHHASHPLPAHLQFPSHAQVAAAASYGFAPLSPKNHQYQPASLWFAEWKSGFFTFIKENSWFGLGLALIVQFECLRFLFLYRKKLSDMYYRF